MDVVPAFDRLLLIEKNPKRFAALERLAADFPQRKIEPHPGDANEVVQGFCRKTQWRGPSSDAPKGMRGVAFLDPYGMQVDWATVEAIAATQSLDVWYFFPLMGLYRQAANLAVKISPRKRARLIKVLGTDEWEAVWYDKPHGPTDLFDRTAEAVRTADVNGIEAYVKRRLETVFKGAVLKPLRFHNDRGHPLASLFFAVSNPSLNAVKPATRIANYILARNRIPG
jgi:three-Cys-motif partner protein